MLVWRLVLLYERIDPSLSICPFVLSHFNFLSAVKRISCRNQETSANIRPLNNSAKLRGPQVFFGNTREKTCSDCSICGRFYIILPLRDFHFPSARILFFKYLDAADHQSQVWTSLYSLLFKILKGYWEYSDTIETYLLYSPYLWRALEDNTKINVRKLSRKASDCIISLLNE